MNKCPNCGAEFEGNFCPNCGEKWQQQKTCPKCGAILSGSARFCTECGYSFVQQKQKRERTANPALAKIKQKLSVALGWVKSHLKIVVPVALLLVTLIVLLSLIPTFIAMKTNGTYYSYYNGEFNEKNYLTLSFGAWTDDDGESGSYKIEGDNITIYVDFMGEEMEFATGIVTNGVLKLENAGTYCRKDHSHFGEWEVIKAATCTEDGTETRTCLCGVKETREVKCVGHHDFGGWVTTEEPTCTKDGKQAGKCSRCEATDIKPLEALGHDFKNDLCTRCNEPALQLKLSSDSSYYMVTKYYLNDKTSVVIPSQKNNIPVTEIGKEAFSYCTGLTSITISNSVTKIGSYAFFACTGLTSITIPDSVTTIDLCAFDDCTGLTSVTIPNSVTEIGGSAFYDCNNLTSIYYAGNLASWCGISGLDNLMSSNRTLYIDGKELVGELIIPDCVTTIGSGAFA